jgi:hypothetical protein
MTVPIELTVAPHPDDALLYRACWADGEEFLPGIPEPLRSACSSCGCTAPTTS